MGIFSFFTKDYDEDEDELLEEERPFRSTLTGCALR